MEIKIYTDGACGGNPGPGGWAAVILNNKSKIVCNSFFSKKYLSSIFLFELFITNFKFLFIDFVFINYRNLKCSKNKCYW